MMTTGSTPQKQRHDDYGIPSSPVTSCLGSYDAHLASFHDSMHPGSSSSWNGVLPNASPGGERKMQHFSPLIRGSSYKPLNLGDFPRHSMKASGQLDHAFTLPESSALPTGGGFHGVGIDATIHAR